MTSPQHPGQTPAGWYPDPNGSGQRYYDGNAWTEHFSDTGQPAQAQQPAQAEQPGGYAQQPGGYAQAPPYAEPQPKAKPGPAPSLWWAVPALAVLALIGALGKWVSADLQGQNINSTSGIDGDGGIMLFFVVVAVVLLVIWRQNGSRALAIVGGVMAAIATILPLIYVVDPSTGAEGALVDVADWSTGWGAYLSFIACLALTVLAFVLAAQRRPPA